MDASTPGRAAAVALADLAPATGAEEPGRVVHGLHGHRQARTGPLHAMADGATACGLPAAQVSVLRQLFTPGSPEACPRCAELLAAPPGPPG